MNYALQKDVKGDGEAVAGGKNLLVIEDDKVQRMFVREVAEPAGFAVDEAPSLEEALEYIYQRDYDTVVVDLALGNHDGVEVIRRIVSSGKRPDVIVMSGFDNRIRDAVARMAAANGLMVLGDLKKPVKPGDLRRCLAGATQRADRKAGLTGVANVARKELAEALVSGRIVPVFQPQVSLATGEVVGVEVMPSWVSPKHGEVPAEVFAKLAEAEGLACALSERILDCALREGSRWCKSRPDLQVAVDLPSSVLTDLEFPDRLAVKLKCAGMRPENFCVEVTEGAALADMPVTSDVMARLSIKGVGLALDEFGTGWASLSLLRNFPFGQIKISKSFVADLHRSTSAWSIIQGVVAMAKATSLSTLADGVDTRVAAEALAGIGVDFGQGALYASPTTAEEVTALLRS
ncbi:EAL domain-containing protein (putative c-di-GMP-specific phosphodiesterase class I)/CheY-like chemotaxis protein [Bradyrhizobium sp. USDA 4341]